MAYTDSNTPESRLATALFLRALYRITSARCSRSMITAGDLVLVQSPYGEAKVRAQVNATVQSGQVFMPMHDEQTNLLTHAHYDPHSRQPSFKNTIVRLQRCRTNRPAPSRSTINFADKHGIEVPNQMSHDEGFSESQKQYLSVSYLEQILPSHCHRNHKVLRCKLDLQISLRWTLRDSVKRLKEALR